MGICFDYNKRAGFDVIPRMEYVSCNFLQVFGKIYGPTSMNGNYVYETKRMIDLSGKIWPQSATQKSVYEKLFRQDRKIQEQA